MQVQYYNTTQGTWVVADDTINESTARIINPSEHLSLDTIFNGHVSTSDLLSEFGNGTYRVYASFRDQDDEVLLGDYGSLLEATWEFTITTS